MDHLFPFSCCRGSMICFAIDTWHQVFCVLLPSVLYMFSNGDKKDLIGIINLSRPHDNHVQLAKVSKHTKPTWDIVENIGTTIGLLGFNFTGSVPLTSHYYRHAMAMGRM